MSKKSTNQRVRPSWRCHHYGYWRHSHRRHNSSRPLDRYIPPRSQIVQHCKQPPPFMVVNIFRCGLGHLSIVLHSIMCAAKRKRHLTWKRLRTFLIYSNDIWTILQSMFGYCSMDGCGLFKNCSLGVSYELKWILDNIAGLCFCHRYFTLIIILIYLDQIWEIMAHKLIIWHYRKY